MALLRPPHLSHHGALLRPYFSHERSLGQNFLTDDGILENIVASSGVRPGDLVLEVR